MIAPAAKTVSSACLRTHAAQEKACKAPTLSSVYLATEAVIGKALQDVQQAGSASMKTNFAAYQPAANATRLNLRPATYNETDSTSFDVANEMISNAIRSVVLKALQQATDR